MQNSLPYLVHFDIPQEFRMQIFEGQILKRDNSLYKFFFFFRNIHYIFLSCNIFVFFLFVCLFFIYLFVFVFCFFLHPISFQFDATKRRCNKRD